MNDVILNKKVSIERCIAQVKKYYAEQKDIPFEENFMLQDAIAMNMQRACEQAIDIANYTVKKKKLGLPKSSKDSFTLLSQAAIIDNNLSTKMQKMVGFRNILVHEYDELDLQRVKMVVEHHLDDILDYASKVLNHFG